MRTQTSVSAGGVIFEQTGEVVVCSRRSFKGDLQWGLPKGLVEKGESIAEAAVREAREESGLKVEVIRELETIDYWFVQPPRGNDAAVRVHKFVHFFIMLATGGDPSEHDEETEEVVVLPANQAAERCTFGSEAELIRKAVRTMVDPA
ncbi:MAG: NUDIX hydrolase [Actinomycetota bacterium]|nr:NUDIX domain-containing protein [Actinomycetota bacterium]